MSKIDKFAENYTGVVPVNVRVGPEAEAADEMSRDFADVAPPPPPEGTTEPQRCDCCGFLNGRHGKVEECDTYGATATTRQVERLRAAVDEERAMSSRFMRERDEARQQVADLRAGIERALAELWTADHADDPHDPICRAKGFLCALLAGSGEQAGERCPDVSAEKAWDEGAAAAQATGGRYVLHLNPYRTVVVRSEPGQVSAEALGRALEEHAPIGRAWYRHNQGVMPSVWVFDLLASLGITVTDTTDGGAS